MPCPHCPPPLPKRGCCPPRNLSKKGRCSRDEHPRWPVGHIPASRRPLCCGKGSRHDKHNWPKHLGSFLRGTKSPEPAGRDPPGHWEHADSWPMRMFPRPIARWNFGCPKWRHGRLFQGYLKKDRYIVEYGSDDRVEWAPRIVLGKHQQAWVLCACETRQLPGGPGEGPISFAKANANGRLPQGCPP